MKENWIPYNKNSPTNPTKLMTCSKIDNVTEDKWS